MSAFKRWWAAYRADDPNGEAVGEELAEHAFRAGEAAAYRDAAQRLDGTRQQPRMDGSHAWRRHDAVERLVCRLRELARGGGR